jgi:hypothetical protein
MKGSPLPNSTQAALKLVDKARALGIPYRMQASYVKRSDSRYIILFPGKTIEATVRISSHPPYEDRYALNLDLRSAKAVEDGIEWLENKYGDGKIQEAAARGWYASASVSDTGGSGDGHLRSGGRSDHAGKSSHPKDRLRSRNPRRVRDTSEVEEWLGSKARHICPELTGDN